MDWREIEEIKLKRKDSADKELKIRLAAYEKSVHAVKLHEKQLTQQKNHLEHISRSPFKANSVMSQEAIAAWRSKIAAAQSSVQAAEKALKDIKKNSNEHLSQWHHAKTCYQTALMKYEKCIEARKDNDKYQKQAQQLESDRQLDELPPRQLQASVYISKS